jgi:hypothetical protein
MKPLAIDLFCGLGGWAEGFLAEGYDCIGFDIERHCYGDQKYPAQLVLQDVLTLHGRQFKDVAAIVASPPCQKYSYMAMPWDLAKREIRWQKWERDSPFEDFRLNDLFDACFRLQREASEAAGRHIPMVVENVKGAQPWVGRAQANFGSFYLWGDVRSVGGRIVSTLPKFGDGLRAVRRGQKFLPGFAGFNALRSVNPDGTEHPQGSWFAVADSKERGAHIKNDGGSWFAQAHNTESGHSQNPVTGEGVKQHGSGEAWFDKALDERRKEATATKGFVTGLGKGHDWRQDPSARFNSKSNSRKAASAMIAKIPFDLARHIAKCLKPERIPIPCL